MKSYIHLIRHGITEGNLKSWYYGREDLPLSEIGIKTIEDLATKGGYPKADETAFYTTGLTRTEQTFKLIYGEAQHKQIPLLQEMDFGEFECKTYEELKDHPGFIAWVDDSIGDVAFPGGESKWICRENSQRLE